MNQKTENGFNLLIADEFDEPFRHAQIHRSARVQRGDGNPLISQLIRNRTPAIKAGNLNFKFRIRVQANRQFPNNRRRPANLQVGDQ